MATYFPNGRPWKEHYGLNSIVHTDLGVWDVETSLPVGLYGSQAVITKDIVYLLGGRTGPLSTDIVATIYSAPIDVDGIIGTWSTNGTLPGVLAESQVVVAKDKIYLLGGNDGTATDVVYSATVSTSGVISSWVTSTSLAAAVRGHQVIATEEFIHLLGGYNSLDAETAKIYSAPIDALGVIGTWVAGTDLPYTTAFAQAFKSLDRIYIVGGQIYDGAASPVLLGTLLNVYSAPLASGVIGTWDSQVSYLNDARSHAQIVATSDKMFMLGGMTVSYNPMGNTYYLDGLDTSEIATFDTNGEIVDNTNWDDATDLIAVASFAQVVTTSNKMYLLGGTTADGETASSSVISVDFSGGANDYIDYDLYDPPVPALEALGLVEPLLVEVAGVADNYIQATGRVEPLLPQVSGVADSYRIALGNVIPKLAKVSGVTDSYTMAAGVIKPKQVKISGKTSDVGSVSPGLASLSGIADNYIQATGNVRPKLPAVNGSTKDITTAYGSVRPKLVKLSGLVPPITLSTGSVSPKTAVISAVGYADIISKGTVRPRLTKISGKTYRKDTTDIIKYNASCRM